MHSTKRRRYDDALVMFAETKRIREENSEGVAMYLGLTETHKGMTFLSKGDLGEAQNCFSRATKILEDVGSEGEWLNA